MTDVSECGGLCVYATVMKVEQDSKLTRHRWESGHGNDVRVFSWKSIGICCAVRLKELSWVWEMAYNWSRDKVDDVQAMSEGKDDEMDKETCSELCQDSDIDGSEFPGC